jgi:hypothetical protein
MSFDHPEASGATILTQTGSFCPLTNALPEITNCSGSQDINPGQTGVIYTYQGVNGSSTASGSPAFNQLGLTFEIYSVINSTTSQDVTNDPLLNPFSLNENTGEMTFTESIARGNLYAVQVRAYDYEGVQPGLSGICDTNYNFLVLETVDFGSDPEFVICKNILGDTDEGPRFVQGSFTVYGYPQGHPEETRFEFKTTIELESFGISTWNNQEGTATLTIGTTQFPTPADSVTISIPSPGVTLPPATIPSESPSGIIRYTGTYYYRIDVSQVPQFDPNASPGSYVRAKAAITGQNTPLP